LTDSRIIKTDPEAYKLFKHHRKWFNKLYVSEMFGYNCGPCGIAPEISEEYIVRPIYNLTGMGVGASVKYIEAGDVSKTPPGYFWCEYFYGDQYSVTYEYDNGWKPLNCWKGHNQKNDLSRFSRWSKDSHYPALPDIFEELSDVGRINVEFIKDKPIEVHLRVSPDPEYNTIIPIWEGDKKTLDSCIEMGYTYVESFDNADGFLETPRLGFMVK
jgi:hypothetical protein